MKHIKLFESEISQRDIEDAVKSIKKDTDNILQLSDNLKNKPQDLIDLSEELDLFLRNFLTKKTNKLASQITDLKKPQDND